MEGLVKGDIVVIDFPFSNLKNSKRRPVLLLKLPKGEDVIVCQITGLSYERDVEMKITANDFSSGSLKRDSFVRIDKISSIEKNLIKYKIGSLKKDKFNTILDKIIYFLKN